MVRKGCQIPARRPHFHDNEIEERRGGNLDDRRHRLEKSPEFQYGMGNGTLDPEKRSGVFNPYQVRS